jgi:hypothetical protein
VGEEQFDRCNADDIINEWFFCDFDLCYCDGLIFGLWCFGRVLGGWFACFVLIVDGLLVLVEFPCFVDQVLEPFVDIVVGELSEIEYIHFGDLFELFTEYRGNYFWVVLMVVSWYSLYFSGVICPFLIISKMAYFRSKHRQ